MSDIRLLDCTLRDGGYVNDWKFGHDSLVGIFVYTQPPSPIVI
jgi:4-hydroxy 2-oxovalerate aldolase